MSITRTEAASSRLRARYRRYRQHSPTLVAAFARLVGLLVLVDAMLPAHDRIRAHQIIALAPAPVSDVATAVAAASGLLLLRVAAGLRRRKRRAWRIALVATSALGVVALLGAHGDKDRGAAVLAITLALLAMLITARDRFTSRSDPGTRWLALQIPAQLAAAGLVIGVIALYLNPEDIDGHPSFGARVLESLAALVGLNGPVRLGGERFREVFGASLLAIGLLAVAVALVLTLRPPEPVAQLTDADDARLRAMLARHGHRDSLGYFALRRDKAVVWSASGKAAITYRVVHGVILASGDPLGDPEAWPGAIAAYRQLAETYGWVQAVIGCSELGATIYQREAGLHARELGDEAIVTTNEFSLGGRPMRGVRQACTRIARAGYAVQIRRTSDIDASELTQLAGAANAWRTDSTERGFSMALSRPGSPADLDCVVVTATEHGILRGLLQLVPWGDDGLSLDLMRRDRTADNGLNEYLIAKLLEAAPGLAVARVSLNFVVFRDAIERGARIGAGPFLRAWRRLLLIASRWWQIESLYRFNVKFRPTWQPRFLSYEAVRDLPRIMLASLEAEAFVTRPRIVSRAFRRTPRPIDPGTRRPTSNTRSHESRWPPSR